MSRSEKFDYKLIYSRRRSISVKIADDNAIVVRCPYGTPQKRIDDFLNSKRRWLDRHVAKNNAAANLFSGVFGYRQILVGGRLFDLEICGENRIGDGTVKVKNMSSLRKLFTENFGGEFMARFKDFAVEHNFAYKSVKFGNYKAKWGSCDGQNNIVFNYKLLMLPVGLQNFVIAHELCHTVHHNHSRLFHDLLDAVFPSNRRDEKELKNYSFVARLYVKQRSE